MGRFGQLALIGVMALGLLAITACSERTGWLADQPPAADVEFVIPAGTAGAAMRGEPAFTLPSKITLEAGQSIVISNEDQAMHYFFDAPIAPHTTYRKPFNAVGRFGYNSGLSCSVDKAGWNGVIVEVVGR